MICLLAKNNLDAERFARSQDLKSHEWFWPRGEYDLINRKNFHVIVVGDQFNLPSSYFEKLYNLAKERGAMK